MPPTGTKGPCPPLPLARLAVGPRTKATYCPGPKGCRDKWPGTKAYSVVVNYALMTNIVSQKKEQGRDVWSHVEEDKVYHKVIEEHFTLMEKLCLLLLLLLLFNSHVHNRWDFSFSLTASIGLARFHTKNNTMTGPCMVCFRW